MLDSPQLARASSITSFISAMAEAGLCAVNRDVPATITLDPASGKEQGSDAGSSLESSRIESFLWGSCARHTGASTTADALSQGNTSVDLNVLGGEARPKFGYFWHTVGQEFLPAFTYDMASHKLQWRFLLM